MPIGFCPILRQILSSMPPAQIIDEPDAVYSSCVMMSVTLYSWLPWFEARGIWLRTGILPNINQETDLP